MIIGDAHFWGVQLPPDEHPLTHIQEWLDRGWVYLGVIDGKYVFEHPHTARMFIPVGDFKPS
jgi:hypothetical protein